MSDIRQYYGNTFVDPQIILPFKNVRTGFEFVVRLNQEFNWFERIEGNIYTQIENVIKCFKHILQREDSKARDYIEAKGWTDIYVKCPFHYDNEVEITQGRPHLTAIVNGEIQAYHFYATKNCRAFTNLTRVIIENVDWSFSS